MTDPYYAETAYDSTRPRDLPSGNNNQFGLGTRGLRKKPLRGRGCHCREYLAIAPTSDIDDLKDESPERQETLSTYPGHEYQIWLSGSNPVVLVAMITWMAGFLLFNGILFFLILFFIFGPINVITYSFNYIFLLPILIYLPGKFILRKDLVQNKNNILLNRRTGLVTLPWLRGKTKVLPFDEFDPYYVTIVTTTGGIDYVLHLGHRYSKVFFQMMGGHSDYWYMWLQWEFWQQYMDISQPLPDVPYMEPYRANDPVTAEYDRRNNRPTDYWKSQDIETVRKMKKVTIKAADKYPWGATRQQAMAKGWRPSGYGEGPSTKMPLGIQKTPLGIPQAQSQAQGPSQAPPPPTEEEKESWAYIEERGDFERF